MKRITTIYFNLWPVSVDLEAGLLYTWRMTMRKFEGLSDFFRNVTDEEKREVYSKVIEKVNEEQLKTIEKAKEIKEDGAM